MWVVYRPGTLHNGQRVRWLRIMIAIWTVETLVLEVKTSIAFSVKGIRGS